tara:strand:+ start:22613 stop:22918 length:306 start_codon:yes stop_codon:yes gene_type:complete
MYSFKERVMDIQRIEDQSDLYLFGDVGAAVMEHRDNDPELTAAAWLGFDKATYYGRDERIVAVFSGVSLSGWGRDEATISAVQTEGNIVVRHVLERDKPRR